MNASFFSCLFETLPASSGCNQAWRRWTPFDACRRSSFPPAQRLKGVWTNTIVFNLLYFLYVINKNFKIIKKVCFDCHSHEDKIHTRHQCNRLSFMVLKIEIMVIWWQISNATLKKVNNCNYHNDNDQMQRSFSLWWEASSHYCSSIACDEATTGCIGDGGDNKNGR